MSTPMEGFPTRAPLGNGNGFGMNSNPGAYHHYPPQPQMQQYGNANAHWDYMRALPPPSNDFSSSSFEASTSSNAPGSTSHSWQYVPPQPLQNGYSHPQTPCNNNPNPFFNGGKSFQGSTPSSISSAASFADKTYLNSTSDTGTKTQGGCFSSKKCRIM
ncbi:unnamed protein product [Orchesella dallaii]|uniref:Uncharacterized protein n=1 Tax=Orchesella dallaii TaxID=48710 RepID=A0ABP1Q0H1_9HEXA